MSAGFAAGELDVITLDDFMRYWQELVETGLSDHIGKFWFLVRRPGSDSLQPEDLRPVIKSLVDYHVDLSAFRTDSDLLEAYITTVLIGIFCSLHGQVCACVCMCAFARSPYPPSGHLQDILRRAEGLKPCGCVRFGVLPIHTKHSAVLRRLL